MIPSSPGLGPYYAVCALPRSGSWLLTLGLEDSGLAGRPRPYLCGLAEAGQPPGPARLSRVRDSAASIRQRTATPNGTFGIKIESTDLPGLMRYVTADGSFGGTESDLLNALFPGIRYVYLARHDKTRQALSLLRGLHTHRWMATSAAAPADGWEPAMEQVDAIRAVLIEQERQWEAFFSAAELEPHRVGYEELTRDEASYRAAIYGVLRYLGISAEPPLPPPRLRRQADHRTDDLVRAYEAWRAARGGQGPGSSEQSAALRLVAALPREAHMMLGDGRLSLDEALALGSRTATAAAPSLGSQLIRALNDDATDRQGAPREA